MRSQHKLCKGDGGPGAFVSNHCQKQGCKQRPSKPHSPEDGWSWEECSVVLCVASMGMEVCQGLAW